MTTPDYHKALADARDALAIYLRYGPPHYGEPLCGYATNAIDALDDLLAALDAPAAAVPEGGLRDSVLNSAKFRASCYALVGVVEGIEGLGRNWAANGERLKDTREWVAFYNCVASMRNGTLQPAALAVPEAAALVQKWREQANAALRRSGTWNGNDMADRIERMADELAALLAAERNGGES